MTVATRLGRAELAGLRGRGAAEVEERRCTWRAQSGRNQRQVRLALDRVGLVDPTSLEDAVAAGAFFALDRALFELGHDGVLAEIKRSGLRERDAGGFPLALKLEMVCGDSEAGERIVIANAVPGDPGSWVERALLEGDPMGVVEGLALLAWVTGARLALVAVPGREVVAIGRVKAAIAAARAAGLVGEGVLGSPFSWEIEVRPAPCSAVCTEETALIAALEGRRGMPSPRPPYPTQRGLHGRPTLVTGVETVYHLAPIVRAGGARYAALGRPPSTGTKVVALSGAVRWPGLVEVPLGTALQEIVEVFGGGAGEGRTLKAVQVGGPAGAPLPLPSATPLGFEALAASGANLGSGGIVAIDERTCVLDLARVYLEHAVQESCGKCPPCRVGTAVLVELVDRIQRGEGSNADIEMLEAIGEHLRRTSLCTVGQHAADPLLGALRWFRAEISSHVEQRRCPARSCARLVTFQIDAACCDGCGECVPVCPENAIRGEHGAVHAIDQATCTHCGVCVLHCPVDAIDRV